MSATPRITLKHLRGACKEQRAIFKREFPDGAPLTLATARKAARLRLDVVWLALDSNRRRGVLVGNFLEAFHTAWGRAIAELNDRDGAHLKYRTATAEAFVRIYREQLKAEAKR